MQAVRLHAPGSADTLQAEDIPIPEPGPGQARIRVEAIGVNYIDIYQRNGQHPGPLPGGLGQEAAGAVDAIGPDVTGVKVGDRVAYTNQLGAYAEYQVVPAAALVPIPDGVSSQLAASIMLQGMTAHYLTHSTFPLQPGQICLAHAAAGGVGQLLVQIAKRRGARVIGTVSTEEKERLAREAGADDVIRYTEVDFVSETRRLTDGAGVHVVYDSVGKTTFLGSMDTLRLRGMLVLYGAASGAPDPVDPALLHRKGSLFLTRPSLMHYTATRDELLQRADDLFRWIADGELKVRIDTTFPLAQAAEAHKYMEARRSKGKVLLIP